MQKITLDKVLGVRNTLIFRVLILEPKKIHYPFRVDLPRAEPWNQKKRKKFPFSDCRCWGGSERFDLRPAEPLNQKNKINKILPFFGLGVGAERFDLPRADPHNPPPKKMVTSVGGSQNALIFR